MFLGIDDRTASFYGFLLLNTPWLFAIAYHAVYRFPPGVPAARFWTVMLVGAYAASFVSFLNQGLVGVRYVPDQTPPIGSS